ncbi:uncharacterized protein LOC144653289 [Oculina patagonica]
MLEKAAIVSAALRFAKKESTVGKFLAIQWNQRLAHKGCLHSISNSGLAGIKLHTCKFTSSLNSNIGLFRSLSCNPSELRSTAADSLMRRDLFPGLFCHSHSKYSILSVLVILGTLNPICPLVSSKVNMEKMEEEPRLEINTEKVESSVKSIQAEASTDVTGVNQKDIPANQDSILVSNSKQEKVLSDLEHERKSDQHFSKETCASEACSGVPGQAEQEKPITDTDETECLPSIDSPKDNDINCDDESFGLDTLFDEDLQWRDAARWTTQSKPKSKQRKRERRKRKQKLDTLSDDDDTDIASTSASKDDGLSPKGKKKPKRITPNYFLAIRVSNPQIHSGIKIVQDSITTHNEKLTAALIPLATLHLTLMVMHLEDEEQIQKATEVLNQCRPSLEPILQNSALRLTFSGLDQFGHQVLYVKIFGEKEMEVLKSVVNIVRETFTNKGIPSTDSREFSPHLTVMKLSRHPKLRKNGIKKIPVESYANWVDMSFGEEPVNALHLCSMNKKKEKDGFYKCVATVTFDDAASDHSPIEAGNAITEDNVMQDNSIKNTEQEAMSTRTATCDKENVDAGENIENASCDEDLSKEIDTWTVDDNMEDAVVNEQLSELRGDSEGNDSKSDK